MRTKFGLYHVSYALGVRYAWEEAASIVSRLVVPLVGRKALQAFQLLDTSKGRVRLQIGNALSTLRELLSSFPKTHAAGLFDQQVFASTHAIPRILAMKAFAQALAKGKTADEAYALAGYKPSRHNASRLTTNDNVRKRVTELQARVAEKAVWTAADRLKSLQAIHDASIADDRRTAIAAIAEANKMDGSYPPSRHQHSGPNGGPIEYANLTEEEIDARLAALAGGASASDA